MDKHEKLILYLVNKFHGNWDSIFGIFSNKEIVDWDKVNNINFPNDCEYMPIISKNYPDKLKKIYMPPFALFYDGDIKYLNYNVLTIIGKLTKNEIDKLLSTIKNNDVICILNKDLTEYFINKIEMLNIKAIIVFEKSIKCFKYQKNKNNILLISENNDLNCKNSFDQTTERLLYAFADKIFIKKASKATLEFLNKNYEDVPKNFYSLEKNKSDNKLIEIFNKNQVSFIQTIEDINL